MPNAPLRITLTLVLAAVLSLPAQAQRYDQYARAAVPSSQVLGMGDAGVAFSGPETAFFYNPAHLASAGLAKPRIDILGVQGELNSKFFDDLSFVTDRVSPALDDGIDVPLTEENRALFTDALAQGRRPTVGQAAALLPSVMVGFGNYAVGAGLFAHNTTRYRFEDNGTGIPVLDLFSQSDAIVALSGAAAVPTTNLSVGITGKYVRRYIGYKNKDFLAIDPDNEQLYFVNGSTVTFDLGLQYTDAVATLPGSLDFGLAVYDLVGGNFSYDLFRALDLTGGDAATDDAEVQNILSVLDGRDGEPAVRLGAAYRHPAIPSLPVLGDLGVALDYLSRSTSEVQQPFLSKFRLGGQATVAGLLALRLGISQGYPTFGTGIHTSFFRLDYVFYGVEDGRLPGQLERYNHLVQVRFGLF
ncbi:MAG: hypothetical protein AAGI91_07500 [Bacteroidota bacterium]